MCCYVSVSWLSVLTMIFIRAVHLSMRNTSIFIRPYFSIDFSLSLCLFVLLHGTPYSSWCSVIIIFLYLCIWVSFWPISFPLSLHTMLLLFCVHFICTWLHNNTQRHSPKIEYFAWIPGDWRAADRPFIEKDSVDMKQFMAHTNRHTPTNTHQVDIPSCNVHALSLSISFYERWLVSFSYNFQASSSLVDDFVCARDLIIIMLENYVPTEIKSRMKCMVAV